MKFEDLSFVGLNLDDTFPKVAPWKPERTGDYAKDCELGRGYFRDLYDHIIENDNPTLLSRVLAAQVKGGVWEAVEIGFSQAMSERLMLA